MSIPDGISGALKPLVLVIDAWPGVGDGPLQIEAGRAPRYAPAVAAAGVAAALFHGPSSAIGLSTLSCLGRSAL